MSNTWTGLVPVIDTAEDHDGVMVVDYFEWHPAAADNDLEIQDKDANVIWKVRAKAAAANGESYAVEISKNPRPIKCRGVYVKTIDAGTLYIHKTENSP